MTKGPEELRIDLAQARVAEIVAAGDLTPFQLITESLIEVAAETDDGGKVPVWLVWDSIGAGLGFEEFSAEGLGPDD